MAPDRDAVDSLSPALRVGERVSVRVDEPSGAREVIGFVTTLDAAVLGVVDRRGTDHRLPRPSVGAVRRVAVSLGRRPDAAPRDLLDDLAVRAGVEGTCWVARISDLLAGREAPEAVPAWGSEAEAGGVRARFEGEWVTLGCADEDAIVTAAWWATRMGARSVQVRCDDDLSALGFVRR